MLLSSYLHVQALHSVNILFLQKILQKYISTNAHKI